MYGGGYAGAVGTGVLRTLGRSTVSIQKGFVGLCCTTPLQVSFPLGDSFSVIHFYLVSLGHSEVGHPVKDFAPQASFDLLSQKNACS